MGGAVAAVEQRYIQDEIAKSSYEYQLKVERGEKIIVGVNQFTVDKEIAVPGFKIDESIRSIQSEKLAHLRAKRNNVKVNECLAAIA